MAAQSRFDRPEGGRQTGSTMTSHATPAESSGTFMFVVVISILPF